MKTLMIPQRTANLESSDELPFGMTHSSGTPCPFANDKLAVGYINTCCSFNVEKTAENLASFGYATLATLLKMELTAEMLPDIAQELRRAADALEERYVKPMDTYADPRLGGITDRVPERFNPWFRPAFEKALASIRDAADWYEKVGNLGFDVDVWY